MTIADSVHAFLKVSSQAESRAVLEALSADLLHPDADKVLADELSRSSDEAARFDIGFALESNLVVLMHFR